MDPPQQSIKRLSVWAWTSAKIPINVRATLKISQISIRITHLCEGSQVSYSSAKGAIRAIIYYID
jgi:hypothetical protein